MSHHTPVFLATLLLAGCGDRRPNIADISSVGPLRAALIAGPHSNSIRAGEPNGFDHELLNSFARSNGTALSITRVASHGAALALVENRRVHFAAGLIPVTKPTAGVRFGPSYETSESIVISRRSEPQTNDPTDFDGRRVGAMVGSPGATWLNSVAQRYPSVEFDVQLSQSTNALLPRLSAGEIDFVVLPSIEYIQFQNVYPDTKRSFSTGTFSAVAWAVSTHLHPSVEVVLRRFFSIPDGTTRLARLRARYFDHLARFDYVDARAFRRAYEQRLPKLRALFEQAAKNSGLDWRLLAALSYQESRWDPGARSPTGVHGLMMLTRSTAKELGVSRADPAQAIDGGARYLRRLIDRFPASVRQQHRLWLGLAAYNLGFGHIQDARRIAMKANDNPDTWYSLKKHVAGLSKRVVVSEARHGRARGGQTVHFIRNIRRYFDTLIRLEIQTLKRRALPEEKRGPTRYLAL